MAKVIKWSIFSRKNFQWQKIGLWIILLQHIETQIFFNVNFQKSYEKFFIGIRTKKRFRGRYRTISDIEQFRKIVLYRTLFYIAYCSKSVFLLKIADIPVEQLLKKCSKSFFSAQICFKSAKKWFCKGHFTSKWKWSDFELCFMLSIRG